MHAIFFVGEAAKCLESRTIFIPRLERKSHLFVSYVKLILLFDGTLTYYPNKVFPRLRELTLARTRDHATKRKPFWGTLYLHNFHSSSHKELCV